MNTYGNRCWERPKNPRNARLTILIDTSDHTADVRDLHAVALSCDRTDHIGIRHEVVDVSLVHKGVPERQHLLAVDCRHRSRSADAEIPIDERDTNRLPARERCIIARGKRCIAACRAQRKERTAGGHILPQIAQPL